MATISQRESGRWQAKVRRQGQSPLSRTFKTKVDAEAWARRLESEQERGVWRDSTEAERVTLAEVLDRYERECTMLKKGSVQEASIVRILCDEPIAKLSMARIRSQDVAELRDAWLDADYAPATVVRRLAVLSNAFNVARREWGMESLANPVELVSKPRIANARNRRVSDAEIDAICAATESLELPSIVRLAVESAMRRGELCGLRWEHIDLGERTAHLPHTKNGQSRDVPLSPSALEVLRGLPRRIDARVFGMARDSVTQAFDRATQRAGVDDVVLHDLRHEAISRLASTFQAHELAKITGHRDMRMLLRYYHPRAADLAKKMPSRVTA